MKHVSRDEKRHSLSQTSEQKDQPFQSAMLNFLEYPGLLFLPFAVLFEPSVSVSKISIKCFEVSAGACIIL